MRDIGISCARRCALIGIMNELIHAAGVDGEVVRRAIHLKGALGGYEAEGEPLPIVDNAPPLEPAGLLSKQAAI